MNNLVTSNVNLEAEFDSLFAQQKYSEIISKSNSYAVEPGTQPVLSKYLAAAFFSIGDYASAELLLQQLEAIFYDDANFLSLYAATSRRMSNLVRAEELFIKALAINPDSLQVQNNYANLLIDLSRFDDARTILNSIIQKDSSYNDAINNLKRLVSLASVSHSNYPIESEGNSHASDMFFQDPLLFAFDESEVEYSLSRYNMKASDLPSPQKSLAELPNPRNRDLALEQLAAATHAFKEKEYQTCLILSSQVYKTLGPDSNLYDLVSDCLLNLNRYQEAEMFLLHSYLLGGISLKRCFNLVSFALMRKDFVLAKHYLSKAAEIDTSSSDLKRLSKMVQDQTNTNTDFVYNFLGS